MAPVFCLPFLLLLLLLLLPFLLLLTAMFLFLHAVQFCWCWLPHNGTSYSRKFVKSCPISSGHVLHPSHFHPSNSGTYTTQNDSTRPPHSVWGERSVRHRARREMRWGDGEEREEKLCSLCTDLFSDIELCLIASLWNPLWVQRSNWNPCLIT